jgi:hypothetical protein
MRKVHPTDMVAHLWAHQTQDSARNPHGNFYFEGDTIYSYGSHFPIARHVDAHTIFFTTRGYSNTTSGHISCVRSAMPGGKRVFHVHNPAADGFNAHRDNHDHMLAVVANLAAKFETSRLEKASLLKSWQHAILAANVYAKQFKIANRKDRKPLKLKVTAAMRKAIRVSEEKRKQHAAAVAQRRADRYARFTQEQAEAARLRAEAEAQWERDREAVWQAWLRGEGPTSALKDRRERPVMLRVIPEGTERPSVGGFSECDLVETTLGAIVPLEDVHKAYALWTLCYNRKRSWHRNGEQIKVGDFQLDAISETGDVVAGCHRIHAEEVLRFAATQGWTK